MKRASYRLTHLRRHLDATERSAAGFAGSIREAESVARAILKQPGDALTVQDSIGLTKALWAVNASGELVREG